MPARQPINIQPKRILVITLRYLGDTLLVTPLIRSLKRAYPHAEIDVLLPSGNIGMLGGNPDIAKLIPIPAKPGLWGFGKLLAGLFKHYDLAISTQAGDRPVLCAVLAGKFSLGFVARNAAKDNWKRRLLDKALEFDGGHTHAVLENLRFCGPLGIEPCYELVPPRTTPENAPPIPAEKYAVLHIMPQWHYKQWHDEGWIKVAYYLSQQGCQVMLTGSPQPAEQKALRALLKKMPPSTRNLAGQLSLPQLAALLESAALFIGPDTGITHLAAATGVLTVALFGPTDPLKWAPWPAGYAENMPPFTSYGSRCVKNVCLIQGADDRGCVPCQQEGCERSRLSRSACLDNLLPEAVISVVGQFL